MAKLIAPLCLAAWLMFVLPAIVSCQNEAMKDIESVRAIASDDRNALHWTKLAMACAKILRELSNRNGMSSEDAVSIVDDLRDSLNHLTDLKADHLNLSDRWINLLSLREKTLECKEDSLRAFVLSARNPSGDPWQLDYVLDCLRDYLNKCGHEDQYKTLIKKIEEKRNRVHEPTLDSFLRKVFWKRDFFIANLPRLGAAYHDGGKIFNRLAEILLFVADLYRFETDHGEKICESPEVVPKFEELIDRSLEHEEQLWTLMGDYFAIYLQECGFERLFKDAMTEHNIAIDTGDSPFASYLWGDFRKSVRYHADCARQIVSAPWILEHVHGKQFECSKDNTDFLHSIVLDINEKEKKKSKLVKFIDDIYENYEKACANEFKTKISQLEESKNEALLFVRNYARQVEAEISHEFKNSPESSRQMIGLILRKHASIAEQDGRDQQQSSSDIGASFIKLRKECQNLWESTETYIYTLNTDLALAAKDDKIMKFIDDIGLCSYKSINIEGMTRSLFNELDAPYFPTKAQRTRPVYRRHFRKIVSAENDI